MTKRQTFESSPQESQAAKPLLPRSVNESLEASRVRAAHNQGPHRQIRESVIRATPERAKLFVPVAGAILAIVAGGVAKEGQALAKPINNVIEWVGQQSSFSNSGLAVPRPGEANTIVIGDTIRYRDASGKQRERQVNVLSDISYAAANAHKAEYADVDRMLEKEIGGTDIVEGGKTQVEVPKSWGIVDISRTGNSG